ncbi:MAG: hemerythrin domain-containing protein [Myxococcales bacterium]|nr:hemerythrin domain-containing protein [Myxococcales bacterium]
MTSPVVDELQRQHAHLRALLDRCDALLADAEAGRADADALTTAVRAMARALSEHHTYEEAHLELLGDDPRHAGHHEALALGLDDPSVRALTTVLRDLREHLAREDAVLAGL